MELNLGFFSSAVILVPSIIGLIRFKNCIEDYHPFFYLIWAGLITEICNRICAEYNVTNAYFSNVYIICEALLLLYFFHNTSQNPSKKSTFYITLGVGVLVLWLYDTLIRKNFGNFNNSLYRITYLTILNFIALNRINSIIVRERKVLWKNSMFIICIGIIINFSYKLIMESMWFFSAYFSKTLLMNTFMMFATINIISNLIFSLALLWVPTKKRFTNPL